MRLLQPFFRAAICLVLSLGALAAQSADYPAPQESSWVARDFRFHTGQGTA